MYLQHGTIFRKSTDPQRLFCGIHVSRRTHCTHWSTRIETYYLHTPVYVCVCVCACAPRRLTLVLKVFAPCKQLVWSVSRANRTNCIFVERYTLMISSLKDKEKCAAGRKERNSYYYRWHLNTCTMLYYVQYMYSQDMKSYRSPHDDRWS